MSWPPPLCDHHLDEYMRFDSKDLDRINALAATIGGDWFAACTCCPRNFPSLADGTLVNHGYELPDKGFVMCPGSHEPHRPGTATFYPEGS